MSSTPLLECRDITFERDDVPLFSDVSFKLQSTQALQVTGANGAGKTTLLRIVAGSLTATEGEVLWRGEPVSRQATDFHSDMLYLGHQTGVKASLTPRENLKWFFRLYPSSPGDVDWALHQVRLEGYEDVSCHALSAGQQRRVALARLYLSTATLWILDEPFTSIDVHGVELLELLMQHHLEKGGLIVLTSHQRLGLRNVDLLELETFAVVD